MKWIYLVPIALLLTACGFYNDPKGVEYRQVVVSPFYGETTVVDYQPVDVTGSRMEYY